MATPPYLVAGDDGWELDLSVGRAGRRRFALSDRAEALLVDDLEYGNRDIVPWLTARTLVLAGGVYRPDGRTDSRKLAWSVTGADGGRDATEAELEALAEYLRSVEIDAHAVETVREHVRGSRLSSILSPEEIQSKRERTTGLREIAKDL